MLSKVTKLKKKMQAFSLKKAIMPRFFAFQAAIAALTPLYIRASSKTKAKNLLKKTQSVELPGGWLF